MIADENLTMHSLILFSHLTHEVGVITGFHFADEESQVQRSSKTCPKS